MSFGDIYPPGGNVPSSNADYPFIIDSVSPPNPHKGMAWLNTNNNEMNVWDGAVWVVVQATSGLPQATAVDQLLKAGSAAGFPWTLSTILDSGRY